MKKAILVGALYIGLIWFFWAGIPINIMVSTPTFIAICAAAAIAATGVWLVACLYSINDEKQQKLSSEEYLKSMEKPENKLVAPNNPDNSWVFFIIAIVFGVFVFPITLIFHQTTLEDNELEQYGEFSTGMVVDGSSFKTRKADFTSVTVKFRTKEGKQYTAEHDISAAEFRGIYQYQEIPLIYSKRYPSILRFLRSDEAVNKYSKDKVRDLNVADLLGILELKNAEETNAYLNKINTKWDYKNGDGTSVIFFNNMRKVGLKITDQKELAYMSEKIEMPEFISQLNKAGFTAAGEGRETYYMKDNFIAKVGIQTIHSDSGDGMIGDFKQVTVVNILKAE